MHPLPLLLSLHALWNAAPVAALHESSHQIIRRDDGSYEARELVTREERERRDAAHLHRRQSIGDGGVGVGVAGASAGVGNVTLKVGNIKVKTGDLLLEDIHIGDITVLVSAGVGKRDAAPEETPAISGLPSFAPGQIPDGPVQAVIVAGDETVIYSPPPSQPTGEPVAGKEVKEDHSASTVSPPQATKATRTVERGAVAVVTAKPQVHEFAKRQNVSVGPVSASVGPIGVGIGNVNVTVGDINVALGNLTVKNVTIGNILVSVKLNAAHAVETILGAVGSVVSDVTSVVGGAGGAARTGSAKHAETTKFVKKMKTP